MNEPHPTRVSAAVLMAVAAACWCGFDSPAQARERAADKAGDGVDEKAPAAKPKLDRSGRKRVGTASVYARKFAGRPMADGTPMDPRDDNAASRTLPLGTEAKVTNLETGRSATVTIQDRGPYVKGRIVDLSPSTARRIGITPKEGVAKVEVAPIAIPPPEGNDGSSRAASDGGTKRSRP